MNGPCEAKRSPVTKVGRAKRMEQVIGEMEWRIVHGVIGCQLSDKVDNYKFRYIQVWV